MMIQAEQIEALVGRAGRAAEERPASGAPELARLAEYALEAAHCCRWDPRKRAAYLLAAAGYAQASLRATDSN